MLAALRKRRRTGQGEYIELAQLESTVNAIGPAIVAAAAGQTVRPTGNDDDIAAPHGVYPCAGADRWCALAVFGDEQWAATRLVLSAVNWTDHPQFDTVEGRRKARPELDRLVARATKGWDADRLAAELTARGVAASPVQHADDLVRRRRSTAGPRPLGNPRPPGDGPVRLRPHPVPVLRDAGTSAHARTAAGRRQPSRLHPAARVTRPDL